MPDDVIHWSKLSAVQRDELVAHTVFGWQPKQCTEEAENISYDEQADFWVCDMCGKSSFDSADEINHDIINPAHSYTTGRNMVFDLLNSERIKSWSLSGSQDGNYMVVIETEHKRCTGQSPALGDKLTEIVCFNVLRAFGVKLEF